MKPRKSVRALTHHRRIYLSADEGLLGGKHALSDGRDVLEVQLSNRLEGSTFAGQDVEVADELQQVVEYFSGELSHNLWAVDASFYGVTLVKVHLLERVLHVLLYAHQQALIFGFEDGGLRHAL